jgi:tetratricopeptide (TPR) repeat protein
MEEMRSAEMLRTTCKLLCAVAGLCMVGALCLTSGSALAQDELARCFGKANVAPNQRVSACTIIIETGILSGKDLATVFNNRGLSYQMRRDYVRSIADFNEAIRLDPSHATAFFNRARSYHLQKDYDRALADYDKALALDPKDAGAYMNRGNVHASKGDHELAIADFDESIRIDPGDSRAFYNRCDALLEIGKATEALADCNEALRLRPDNTPAFLLRGNVQFCARTTRPGARRFRRRPQAKCEGCLGAVRSRNGQNENWRRDGRGRRH